MAKSSRARRIKANNRRLKKNVFSPVEDARVQRLHEKLLEIASQPKPARPVPEEEMADVQGNARTGEDAMEIEKDGSNTETKTDEAVVAMDIDSVKKRDGKNSSKKRLTRRSRRIEKKRRSKNYITFRCFGVRRCRRKN